MLTPILKRTGELLLSRGPVAWAGRRSVRGRGLILAYHNVVPDGMAEYGDTALHLPLSRFIEQLDCLVRFATPVSLDRLLGSQGERGGRAGRRPLVAVTFDDAYRGAVTAGVAALVARGIPAALFVSPGLLGDRTFWWDALAGAGVGEAQRNRVRRHALDVLAGRDDAVRSWAREEGLPFRDAPPEWRSATGAEVAAAVAAGGITPGAHSWSHPSLPELPDEELQRELCLPMTWLRERFPDRTPWLAYPYGRTSARVQRAAGRHGYSGSFRVAGGWLGPLGEGVHDLPRLSVPSGLSLAGFRARLAGTLGRR